MIKPAVFEWKGFAKAVIQELSKFMFENKSKGNEKYQYVYMRKVNEGRPAEHLPNLETVIFLLVSYNG